MNIDLGNIHLDVYLHDDVDPVQTLLKAILKQGGAIMSKLDDVNAKLDAIVASVSGVAGDVADLKAQIEALKNASAGATPEQVQALFDKISPIADSLAALDASTPSTPPVA